MARKKGTSTKQAADPELLNHIQHLGLETVEEYRLWCVQNGFHNQSRKTRSQRKGELLHYRETVAVSHLWQRKQEKRSIVDKLSAACSENAYKKSYSDPLLKLVSERYRYQSSVINGSEMIRNSFLQLVSHLYCCKAKFFDNAPVNADWENYQGRRYLDALVLIAKEARYWIRPIEKWRPTGSNARRQFASLLRHLFVKYQMPLFFDSVWLMNYAPICKIWRRWYLDIGLGHNIRHCSLPLAYTKKMAHHFMRAPQDLTFLQALRWGQVLGMGGNARLARALLRTSIAEDFTKEKFWSAIIHWLAQRSQLAYVHVRPIVEYLLFQRYGCVLMDDENGLFQEGLLEEATPPVPDYSIKGRTLQSLLRDIAQWHRELESKNRIPDCEWEASEIPEYEHQDEDQENQKGKRWIIRELLNSHELEREGRQMNHCVATYVSSCVSGECSIWSMEIELKGGFKKAITIEVSKESNQICEVRGKANRLPNKLERSVLCRWAESSGLKVSSYV
ncbi:PcfJ domain-containing protein [uncultured Gimesia sp.]|uniref:PcfJ domain-containing protein n=1 Tax=uncultured Gimesia sp. TaxID=1678688 RepID=UPI0030DAC893|tara:strand:- start:87609 stop:89123 length:1515 start_codon:yes stop_codon:yes gene_type:complete